MATIKNTATITATSDAGTISVNSNTVINNSNIERIYYNNETVSCCDTNCCNNNCNSCCNRTNYRNNYFNYRNRNFNMINYYQNPFLFPIYRNRLFFRRFFL